MTPTREGDDEGAVKQTIFLLTPLGKPAVQKKNGREGKKIN
jgi:hypothetical protein